MANKKILLKSTSGDALFPRTSIDNLVDAVGSTVSVSVPVLDANGKLDSSYLPSYVDDIIDLKAITGTAPTTCAVGDMYFNNASGNLKIYTATATNTWGTTGTTPETGKIYVNLADSKIYRWSGSAMVEISKQVSTVTSVRATSSALDTVVPTEKAVATALGGKAASSHTHSIANVSGLQDALADNPGCADLLRALAAVYAGQPPQELAVVQHEADGGAGLRDGTVAGAGPHRPAAFGRAHAEGVRVRLGGLVRPVLRGDPRHVHEQM